MENTTIRYMWPNWHYKDSREFQHTLYFRISKIQCQYLVTSVISHAPDLCWDLTMGRIFLDHIGGTRLFSCANCDTILTNRSELISTRFTGATGRAFLFNKVRCKLQSRLIACFWNCFITFSSSVTLLNPTGGEPAVQWSPGQGDAHWQAHGARRQLQELQQ